jgi:hypothetical protein
MSDDGMNLEASVQELRELEERAFDSRILQELERVPEVSEIIPPDFAARVTAKVPAQRPVEVRTTHYGRAFMGASLVVLFLALVVLATRSFVSSPIGLAIEWTLCIQFLAIAVWMGAQHWRSN